MMALMLALALPASARAQQTQVPQSAQQMHLSFAPLVKRTAPAVVNIYTKRVVRQAVSPLFSDPFFSQFFGMGGFGGQMRPRVENSLGSGVIVSPDGQIATNTHVVKGASEITVVTSDGREYPARKVLVDEKTDLAVLRIDTKGRQLPFLKLADSDALQVGDLVLAIGNPFGLGQTVTSGIVSGLARTSIGNNAYSYFIQTDAAINPGNSGGALIDMEGRLVGINSMIFSKDGGSLGIGFAIPANMVQTVIAASRHGGRIVRPWTGLTGQAVTPDMVDSLKLGVARGALINRVNPHGPGAKAGVHPGDVVLAINGKPVQDPEALKFRLATVPLGADVRLDISRNGQPMTVMMKAEAPPETPARDETTLKGRNPLSGAVVENINPAVTADMGGLSQEAGVVVEKAEQGIAAQLGLSPGDIVVSVNGKKIDSVATLRDILSDRRTRRWQVQVLRGGQVMNLMITL
ncbi:MAG: Do family serine endopeptidase [Alphaproteobacteria bacterium]|nr:Do family serine endopeptidase [Alphaproteobacteria bacterium]